jgi:hypothetical protein
MVLKDDGSAEVTELSLGKRGQSGGMEVTPKRAKAVQVVTGDEAESTLRPKRNVKKPGKVAGGSSKR